MAKIYKLIKAVCTAIGALVLLCGIGAMFTGLYAGKTVPIPQHTMITVDFAHNFSEQTSDNIMDELLGRQSMQLTDLIKSLEIAAGDARIDGIIARLDVSDMELAQVQDVARAIELFKRNGKKTYVFSQGFGTFGQGNREYYLATFFDKIYMQPHTYIGLTGIGIELPFTRKLLDKIGVYPEFYTRYEYKTAMMSFTDKQISPAYRAEMQRLGNSLTEILKRDIKRNRNLQTNMDEIINKAPITAVQGKELGLIDDIMYLPQLETALKDEGVKNFVAVEKYAAQIQPNTGNIPTIAVLNLSGVIDSGENTSDIDGQMIIGSQSVLADLAEIEELHNLKALVVRIDSPGGSYNAADEIYFALKYLKEKKNIPVIISQSGYAASGGYFISLAGNTIVTEPMTITGSIGVLGGKFVLNDLWKKLDIDWVEIKTGKNAGILSINKAFSATERKLFEESLDEVYLDFTAKVTENRQLTKDIDEIARGRVWTGEEAIELGLADKLGGLSTAVGEALRQSNTSPREKYKLVSFPREKSFSEKIRDLVLQTKATPVEILE